MILNSKLKIEDEIEKWESKSDVMNSGDCIKMNYLIGKYNYYNVYI